MDKLCDNASVVLSGNNIDFVHETKYLSVIIWYGNRYNIGQETTLRIQRVLAGRQPPKNKLFGTM